MLAPERHRLILEELRTHGSVRTAEVSQALRVTEETIRRDFERLETDGKLQRTHGGALRGDGVRRELSLASRAAMNVPEKSAIAARAAALLEPDDTILLDASSSALIFARHLPDIPLTVLTDSLQAAIELAPRPAIKLVLLGGNIVPRSLSCVGPISEFALESHHVQKAFLSCKGVDASRGLSEAHEEQGRLKAKMIALADHTILLADHTKISLRSAFFFAPLAQIQTLITNRPPAEGFVREATHAGLEILVADEPFPL